MYASKNYSRFHRIYYPFTLPSQYRLPARLSAAIGDPQELTKLFPNIANGPMPRWLLSMRQVRTSHCVSSKPSTKTFPRRTLARAQAPQARNLTAYFPTGDSCCYCYHSCAFFWCSRLQGISSTTRTKDRPPRPQWSGGGTGAARHDTYCSWNLLIFVMKYGFLGVGGISDGEGDTHGVSDVGHQHYVTHQIDRELERTLAAAYLRYAVLRCRCSWMLNADVWKVRNF